MSNPIPDSYDSKLDVGRKSPSSSPLPSGSASEAAPQYDKSDSNSSGSGAGSSRLAVPKEQDAKPTLPGTSKL